MTSSLEAADRVTVKVALAALSSDVVTSLIERVGVLVELLELELLLPRSLFSILKSMLALLDKFPAASTATYVKD